MKLKFLSSLIFILLLFISYCDLFAQNKIITLGGGISSGQGMVFSRYEYILNGNFSIGGQIAYTWSDFESNILLRDDFGQFLRNPDGSVMTRTVVTKFRYVDITLRGSYYFDDLLNLNDSWDIYTGLAAGGLVANNEMAFFPDRGRTRFIIGAHVGSRYYINDNFGFNMEFAVSWFTSLNVGLSYKF